MKLRSQLVAVTIFLLGCGSYAEAQQAKWMAGFNMGLGLETGLPKTSEVVFDQNTFQYVTQESGGGSRASFVFGPSGEVIFNNNMAIVMDLLISTAPGTPILWINTFRYYFPTGMTRVYADAGFGLDFVTGGPYVLLPFGGGALFNVSPNLYIPADVKFGPVFATGTTVFTILISSGIRYQF
jgi:hypothetical protein